ncbi:MAG TPA: FAD-binding oxidoreductase [Burkholderiales bacterium]|nr:FAD-binding oxidoreductase [Burkholderiales bacterium]
MTAFPHADATFVSYDGGCVAAGQLARPDRYAYWDGDHDGLRIPRGAGLSYAAASFGAGALSVEHVAFDRLLALDTGQRLVEVESGVRLGDLYRFLRRHNLYLPVQPGHPDITIGGCIAADVHGKNQSDHGTFSSQVMGLTLFHPRHGVLRATREENPDVFELTCGGYGLTGNVLTATLKVTPLPSGALDVRCTPVDDVEDLPAALREAATRSDFSYSWHDFSSRGRAFGAGFIEESSWRPEPAHTRTSDAAVRRTRITARGRATWRYPIFNRYTTPALNALYRTMRMHGARTTHAPLYECLFPAASKGYYFKMFGRSGFHEYQALVPERVFAPYVREVREAIATCDVPVTLASGKLFAGEQRLLRFTGAGICLALNFPRSPSSPLLMERLDALVIEAGGIPNIIKDSRLPAEVVERSYPEYENFRSALRTYDPQRWYRSELSERLRL